MTSCDTVKDHPPALAKRDGTPSFDRGTYSLTLSANAGNEIIPVLGDVLQPVLAATFFANTQLGGITT